LDEDGARVLQEELDRLGNALDAIEQTLTVYAPGVLDMAGAMVGVDHTGGVVVTREDEVPAAALAQAVCLDMHDWWTPTAVGYFSCVSKAKALEVVAAFAPDHVTRLSRLKKAEIAREAERLAAGHGLAAGDVQGADGIEC